LGAGSSAEVLFENSDALTNGGVLFAVPALLSLGLDKVWKVYNWCDRSYYSLQSIALTLAFMALLRVKHPEHLKEKKPGEMGRLLGLDRIPEVRCLREKIQYLTQQAKARELNNSLIDTWFGSRASDEELILYVDGHQIVYTGTKANIPVKFVSRQKLCLSATTEFLVNDRTGLPVMALFGELNEKLQEAIENLIIPQMIEAGLLKRKEGSDRNHRRQTASCKRPSGSSDADGEWAEASSAQTKIEDEVDPEENTPFLILVMDREAYAPEFFYRLWRDYRIAIITYRKFIKDVWPTEAFKPMNVMLAGESVPMQLCERETTLKKHAFREIRRNNEGKNQTSIITTHPTLPKELIAEYMFARWSQENFLRYFGMEFGLDDWFTYSKQPVDPEKMVINPEYKRISKKLKNARRDRSILLHKVREAKEKIEISQEAQARFMIKHRDDFEKLELFEQRIDELIKQRKATAHRIKVKEMTEEERYNKLETETKTLINLINMICYRAETAMAQNVLPFLAQGDDEKRVLIRTIMNTSADVTPDPDKKTLIVTLHSLSAPRYNVAVENLAKLLTETETVFPGTDLRMIFKTSAFSLC
jgi:hypothetical protein